MWAWAWNMWPWGIHLMLCYKKRTIYIWHIFQSISNTVRISIRPKILMALKIEVQTLTINFCSRVDSLWICMKTKYPKSRKIQSRITLFEFMSPFHWNIVILNKVLLIAMVDVLIIVMFIYVSQISFSYFLPCFISVLTQTGIFLLCHFSETDLPMFLGMFFHQIW